MISEVFPIFCVFVFVLHFDFGSSMGMFMNMDGGGGGGGHGGGGAGLVLITNNKPRLSRKQSDILLINQKGCSPTLIKDNPKGKNILVLGQCQQKKKVEKKVEYVPVPMPVKEYIPVQVKKDMKSYGGGHYGMDMDMAMAMGYGMDSMQVKRVASVGHMYGMDTKKSVSHSSPEDKDKKVVPKTTVKPQTRRRQLHQTSKPPKSAENN